MTPADEGTAAVRADERESMIPTPEPNDECAWEDLGDPVIRNRAMGHSRGMYCISRAIALLNVAADNFAFESKRSGEAALEQERALRLVRNVVDLRSLQDAVSHGE